MMHPAVPPHDASSCLQYIKRWAFLFLEGLYLSWIRPHLCGLCRFHPTCSAYARTALILFPPVLACRLILGRLARCHWRGFFEYDPLPQPHQYPQDNKRISS